METSPAVPGGGAETLAAAEAQAIVEKRARKRSRYLSSDYDTAILNDDDDIAVSPRKGEDAAALLLRLQEANLATADLLAALVRSAACPDDSSLGPGVDAGVLLSFFGLHRASVRANDCEDTTTTVSKDVAAAPDGHGKGMLNTCRAVAFAADGSVGEKQDEAIATAHTHAHHIGPANAAAPEAGPKKRKKEKVTFALDGSNAAADCSAQPAAASSAMGHAYGGHIGPANAAAAAPEAGPKRRRMKKVTIAFDGHNAAAPTGSSAQPATGIADGANSAPKKAKKKARNSSGQGHHPGKPVALILDYAQGTTANHPPSKEELLSTFRGFGSLIESDTDMGTRRGRLVFRSSAAAEAAYSCAHTLGTFSARRLQYLRPPPPAPKIPLTDVRKNLEKMIASLTAPSVLGRDGALDLAGQMLHLMAKVDKTLTAAGPGPATAAAAYHH